MFSGTVTRQDRVPQRREGAPPCHHHHHIRTRVLCYSLHASLCVSVSVHLPLVKVVVVVPELAVVVMLV